MDHVLVVRLGQRAVPLGGGSARNLDIEVHRGYEVGRTQEIRN